MEGLNCSICFLNFDDRTVIPKVLTCGHSFCLPCLTLLMDTRPVCPNCREPIPGAPQNCATNYTLLNLVHLINSPKSKESSVLPKLKKSRILRRIEALKNKFITKQEDLEKAKMLFTSLLEEDLEKVRDSLGILEELSQEGNLDENAQDVDDSIAELELAYQGLRAQISPDFSNLKAKPCLDISTLKASVSLDYNSFQSPPAYLQEIFRLSQEGERLYSLAKVGEGIRYGKITTHDNWILIHALDLLEMPEGSSTVWFDAFKKCFPPRVFMKIIDQREAVKGKELFLQIDIIGSPRDQFIEICSGETGASYKGGLLERIVSYGSQLLHLDAKLGEEIEEKERGMGRGGYGEGWRCIEYHFTPGDFILQNFSRGNFDIVRYPCDGLCYNKIGKVVFPKEFVKLNKYNPLASEYKIVDCGLLFEC